MNRVPCWLLWAFAGVLCLPAPAALKGPVRTEAGMIAGAPAANPAITVFKGVPFAAPPVGEKRWKAPEAPIAWEGVRQAREFGANCVQTIVDGKKPWTHEFMAHGLVSEDCLFLNIWTPAQSGTEKLPVFVYLHGGANTEGSGSVAVYDGSGLAQKGLVMITVNYRLGVFGFFTYPGLTKESGHNSSGNYALLDQMAALQWVQKNIAAFGGDPHRVTVAGQSAGAGDIQLLTVSPLAKGLFQRAILESSGSSFGGGVRRTLAESEADGVKFAEAKGAHSLQELRAMPWKEFIAPSVRFGPVLDGYVVPGSPRDIFAQGKQNDVPTLAGWNADESGASPRPNTSAEQFRTRAQEQFGDRAAEYLKLYPAGTDNEAKMQSNEAARDRQRVSVSQWAETRAKTSKTPAYLYWFHHVLPGPDSAQYGAFHTSEVPYVLNSLAMSDRPFTDEDRKIANMLSSYWANFAKNGNPNGKGLPHWPSADEKPETVMELGDKTQAIPVVNSPAKQKWMEQALSNTDSSVSR